MKVNTCILLFALALQIATAFPVKASTSAESLAATSEAPKKTVPDIELVSIKGGCFNMGSEKGDSDEVPVHQVCVGDFSLGKYEVTQEQYSMIMESNPSMYKQCGSDCPVDNVSWDNAQEFIKKLNEKSGKNYRLPTEAEWEYAARSAGSKDVWAGTSEEADLEKYAWFNRNSNQSPQKVGQKEANALGLFDMTGNVWEWCQDWYDAVHYKDSIKDNPVGPAKGESRVVRGGAWSEDARGARNAKRDSSSPAHGNDNNGLRLVLPSK